MFFFLPKVGAAGKVQDQSVIRATDTIKEPASNQPALFQYNRLNPTQFDLITTSTEIASEEVVHTIPPTNIGAIQTYLSTSKTSTPLSFREVYVEGEWLNLERRCNYCIVQN